MNNLEDNNKKTKKISSSFKHMIIKDRQVDIIGKTAVITSNRDIDENFDKDLHYDEMKKKISSYIKNQDVFDNKFILIQNIFKKRANLKSNSNNEAENIELYLQFHIKQDKKEIDKHISKFLELDII